MDDSSDESDAPQRKRFRKRKRQSDIFTVQKVKVEHDPLEHLPVKGEEIIPQQYANILLAAPTGSGKTTVIDHMSRHTIDKRTQVFIISSTVNIDPVWIAICDELKKREIDVVKYESLFQDRQNILEIILDSLREQRMRRQSQVSGKGPPPVIFSQRSLPFGKGREQHMTEGEIDFFKGQRPKDKVPENWIILDDLNKEELLSPVVVNLVKKNRHYLARTTISSQHLIHFKPDAFDQEHELLVFGGFSRHYIDTLFERMNLQITKDQFWLLYTELTKEEHSFMTIYLKTHCVRQGFRPPDIDINNLFNDHSSDNDE